MAPWLPIGIGLLASQGISISSGAIEFEPEPATPVCWIVSKKLPKKRQARIERALVRAGRATMPSHVRYRLERVESTQRDHVGCKGYVRITTDGGPNRVHLTVHLRRPSEAEFEVVDRFTVLMWKLRRRDFDPVWRAIWDRLAPSPTRSEPPPPPVSPPAATEAVPAVPFVDGELAREQAAADAPFVAPTTPRGPPVLSLAILAGWSGRTLSDAPGAAQSTANVPTAGASAMLHASSLLGLASGHDLDLSVGYDRRFVEGQQGDSSVAVTADRIRATGRYRYLLGGGYPRIGPLIGYELVRFESDGTAVLSTRFSVIRAGVDVRQPVLRFSPSSGLWLRAASALRWSPTGDAGIGVDARVGGRLKLSFGLFAGIDVRLTWQPGEAAQAAFVDRMLDITGAVGWSL